MIPLSDGGSRLAIIHAELAVQEPEHLFNLPAELVDGAHLGTGQRVIVGREVLLAVSGNGDVAIQDPAAFYPVGLLLPPRNRFAVEEPIPFHLGHVLPPIGIQAFEDFAGSIVAVKKDVFWGYVQGFFGIAEKLARQPALGFVILLPDAESQWQGDRAVGPAQRHQIDTPDSPLLFGREDPEDTRNDL